MNGNLREVFRNLTNSEPLKTKCYFVCTIRLSIISIVMKSAQAFNILIPQMKHRSIQRRRMQNYHSLVEELELLKDFFTSSAERDCPSYFHFERRTGDYPKNEFELVQELATELQSEARPQIEILRDLVSTESVFALPCIAHSVVSLPTDEAEVFARQVELWRFQSIVNQYLHSCYSECVALKYTDNLECEDKLDKKINEVICLFQQYVAPLKELGLEIKTSFPIFR